VFVSRESGNPTLIRIALASGKGRYDMTCPEHVSWVYEAEGILAFQRPEMNAPQSACAPSVSLHGFVPANEEKFYPVRLIYVCGAHDVNMVYANDFSITIMVTLTIIILK
jgi:hypothetical protein